MKRDQFTFYRSYYEALKELPPKDFKAAVLAVCAYALDEAPPSLSGIPNSVFILIRPTLDTGRNKASNRLNKQKTNREQTGNKSEQTRKEKEGEKEGEGESERENDGDPPTPFPPPVAAVLSAYMDRINPTPSQSSLDELRGYAEEMGPACCLRAFDIALDAKKANWPYVRGILRTKLSQGVRCLADWDTLEAKRGKGGEEALSFAEIARRMEVEHT